MENQINEIVKEFEIYVEDLNFPIRARIVKILSDNNEDIRYDASLSHYCKQDEIAIDTYYPSFIRKDLLSTETLLMNYLKRFRNLAVKENKNYK